METEKLAMTIFQCVEHIACSSVRRVEISRGRVPVSVAGRKREVKRKVRKGERRCFSERWNLEETDSRPKDKTPNVARTLKETEIKIRIKRKKYFWERR